jgi:thiamine biosynthesis protein ThiS
VFPLNYAASFTRRADTERQLRIQVNGKAREVEDSLSLPRLVADLELKPEQIAVEVNHQVVRRADWSSIVLQPGDQVEIVHFVGGGTSRRQ